MQNQSRGRSPNTCVLGVGWGQELLRKRSWGFHSPTVPGGYAAREGGALHSPLLRVALQKAPRPPYPLPWSARSGVGLPEHGQDPLLGPAAACQG